MTETTAPAWPCHRCKVGLLVPVKGSFATKETADSAAAHDHPDWEPEWANERFSCLMRCNRAECGDVVAVAGLSTTGTDYDDNGPFPVTVYRPKFVLPAPDMFIIPGTCPENIRTEIQEAFGLFWSDLPACANRIRSSVESLLTYLGIPRFKKAKKGSPLDRYSAHARIKLYEKQNAPLGQALLAVKWLGNAGSHTGDITEKDIFDGFDLLEHVLNQILNKPEEALAALAKKINKKKGPVK